LINSPLFRNFIVLSGTIMYYPSYAQAEMNRRNGWPVCLEVLVLSWPCIHFLTFRSAFWYFDTYYDKIIWYEEIWPVPLSRCYESIKSIELIHTQSAWIFLLQEVWTSALIENDICMSHILFHNKLTENVWHTVTYMIHVTLFFCL